MASPKEGVLRRVELSDVRAPKPLMPAEIERRLTPRQRQVLDSLETLVVSVELADMTMAQIAAQVNCSLRTLYGISPRKEELVLTILDRRLQMTYALNDSFSCLLRSVVHVRLPRCG